MPYKRGSWWFHCPICQFKYHIEDIVKRWDGQYVCKNDVEPRHPLDFMRARKEKIGVFPVQRESVDRNMEDPGITIDTTTLVPSKPAGE